METYGDLVAFGGISERRFESGSRLPSRTVDFTSTFVKRRARDSMNVWTSMIMRKKMRASKKTTMRKSKRETLTDEDEKKESQDENDGGADTSSIQVRFNAIDLSRCPSSMPTPEWCSLADALVWHFESRLNVFSKRSDGSGRWFLESKEYQAWLASSNGVLWCYAIW